jgi:hypothetical protein
MNNISKRKLKKFKNKNNKHNKFQKSSMLKISTFKLTKTLFMTIFKKLEKSSTLKLFARIQNPWGMALLSFKQNKQHRKL